MTVRGEIGSPSVAVILPLKVIPEFRPAKSLSIVYLPTPEGPSKQVHAPPGIFGLSGGSLSGFSQWLLPEQDEQEFSSSDIRLMATKVQSPNPFCW